MVKRIDLPARSASTLSGASSGCAAGVAPSGGSNRGTLRRLTVATFAAAIVTGLSAGTSTSWLVNLAGGLAYGLPTFAVVAGGLSVVAWRLR